MPEENTCTDIATSAGLLVLDQQGIITDASTQAASVFQLPVNELPGKQARHFFASENGQSFSGFLEKLKQEPKAEAYFQLNAANSTYTSLKVQGAFIPETGSYQLSLFHTKNKATPGHFSLGTATENKTIAALKAEIAALQKKVNMQHAAIETTNDIIFVKDTAGKYILVNNAFLKLTRKEENQVYGKTDHEFFLPAIAERIMRDDRQVMQNQKPQLFEETHLINNKRITFLTSKAPILLENGKVIGITGIARDISDLKKAEEKLLTYQKEQELLNMHIRTQEEERSRMAEALHNTVGQIFYGLKYKLQNLNPGNPENKAIHETLYKLVKEGIRETKTISFELRPILLEDFGIFKCIQQLTEKLSDNNLQISCTFSGLKKRLSANTELAVYRIVQELLNNIARHSLATTASVKVSCHAKDLHITIKDNGTGFNLQEAMESEECSGLKNIKRRLTLLNATYQIQSEKEKGTCIRFSIKV